MKPTLLPNEQMRHINDAEGADAAEREEKKMPSVPTPSSGGG